MQRTKAAEVRVKNQIPGRTGPKTDKKAVRILKTRKYKFTFIQVKSDYKSFIAPIFHAYYLT